MVEEISKKIYGLKAQFLLEILVVIGVAAVIVTLGAQLIGVSLQSTKRASEREVGLALVEETFEAVRSAALEKWFDLYSPAIAKNSNYYPTKSAGKWVITNAGAETVTINGINYTRSYLVQNICRDSSTKNVTGITDANGTTVTCTGSGGTYDPSTQKLTVNVSWPNADTLSSSEYITRWANRACLQTNWGGGATGPGTGVSCPVTGTVTTYDTQTNIDFGTTGSIKISP